MRGGSSSRVLSRTASIAARHSSTSKRLAGTRIAALGSSSRWLARPMRWISRLAPFGAPTCSTRSTAAQSMPRSSDEVATTARSPPRAMAASTLRRCSGARLPWWRAIGRLSSFSRHSAWNTSSACARVLTNSSVVRCGLDGQVDILHGEQRHMARPGHALPRLEDADDGRCAGPAAHQGDGGIVGAGGGRQPLPQRRLVGHGGGKADAAAMRRQLRQPRQPERQQVAALGAGQRVQLVHDHPLEPAEHPLRIGEGQQQRQRFRRGHEDLRRLAALPLALGGGRVAGARLRGDRQAPFRRSALPGCGGCRWPAPSAARCRGCAGPGGDAPPGRSATAGIRPASCRRRWARSAAPTAPRDPPPASRADADAAASRGRRTSSQTAGEGKLVRGAESIAR